MLRIIQRNSHDDTRTKDMQGLKQDLIKCGYNEDKLEALEPKAVLRSLEGPTQNIRKTSDNTLVFKTKFMPEIYKLKSLLKSMKADINHLLGDCRVIFALQKHESIDQVVAKNRALSINRPSLMTHGPKISQACGAPRCETCPYLFKFNEKIVVNGIQLHLCHKLTCKDKNAIYFAQCTLCSAKKIALEKVLYEDSYFGQTTIKAHLRFNGHRDCFKIDDCASYSKSALSQHCFDVHPDQMDLSVFKLGIVLRCAAPDLDREENRFVSKFRTNIFGLNRIKIIK